jgi:hypothetical protein
MQQLHPIRLFARRLAERMRSNVVYQEAVFIPLGLYVTVSLIILLHGDRAGRINGLLNAFMFGTLLTVAWLTLLAFDISHILTWNYVERRASDAEMEPFLPRYRHSLSNHRDVFRHRSRALFLPITANETRSAVISKAHKIHNFGLPLAG